MRPAPSTTAPRPRRFGYGLALTIFLGGFALMAAYMIPRVRGLTENMTRFVVPGGELIELDSSGMTTLFHEYRSVVDGNAMNTPAPPDDLQLQVIDHATAVPLLIEAIGGTGPKYQTPGYAGYGLYTFHAPKPGLYRVEARYPDGRAAPRVVLSVGQDFKGAVVSIVFGSLAVVFVCTLLAVGVAVLTYRRK